jgi:tRNA (guanine37-N1)-methyltransferase
LALMNKVLPAKSDFASLSSRSATQAVFLFQKYAILIKQNKMRFSILTLFPDIIHSYTNVSILKRAQAKKLIYVDAIDIRAFSSNKHRTVDDKPYGGGAGMVLSAEPILKAVAMLKKKRKKPKIIIMSAKGKSFTQAKAKNLAKNYTDIIFISGRYEGIDERVKTVLKAEELSIGPYVLTDGDVAAMAIISAVARLVPGVIKLESLQEESHRKGAVNGKYLEYPHYTRPDVIKHGGKKYKVPGVLLSGNHAKIIEWQKKRSKK